MTPFVIGILLIVGGIAFAAAPLLRKRSGEQEVPDDSAADDRPHEQPGGAPSPARTPSTSGETSQRAESTAPLPVEVLSSLEELELDRAMGKLGDRDYEELRAAILRDARSAIERNAATNGAPVVEASPTLQTADVVSAPLAASAPVAAPAAATAGERDLDAEAERLVRSVRATARQCPDCGPRPEPQAAFCSNCGKALGACPHCGADIAHAGARFCDRCGTALIR